MYETSTSNKFNIEHFVNLHDFKEKIIEKPNLFFFKKRKSHTWIFENFLFFMEFFYTCFVVVIVVNIVLKISKIVYDDKLLKNLLQTTIFVTDNFLKSSLIRVFVVFKYIVLRLHLCFFLFYSFLRRQICE